MKFIGVSFYIITSWLLARTPKFIFYGIADFTYFVLYHIIRYRKVIVHKNLKNSFPEKSEKEINRIQKNFYRHLADTFIENLAIIRMSKKRILKFVKLEENQDVQNLYKKGKNIIGITGHYGNWEAFVALPLISLHKVLGVYKPLNNRFFDKQFYNMRKRFGALPVSMKDTYKTALEFKNNNTPFILGLIADQRPHKKAGSYWTTFLNQETPVFLGPEKFAKKLNAAVLFTYLVKEQRGKYLLKTELLFEDTSNCSDFEITETHLRKLEKIIMDKPEYWLWSHNRWKHKRSEETTLHKPL